MGNGKDTRPAGWSSRRHRTNEAHEAAKAAYANRAIGRPVQKHVGGFAIWAKGSAATSSPKESA